MTIHRVRQGESVLSLSKRYGLPPQKIVGESENRALFEQGRNSGVLFPGDELVIPERELKQENCESDQLHRFRCSSRNALLRVRFIMHNNETSAGQPYVLRIDANEKSGQLDDDGWLEERIPVDTRECVVVLGDPGSQKEIHLRIGDLNPIDEISGVKQRLHNLGILLGCNDREELDDETRAAISTFQSQQGITVTGELDANTIDELRSEYGS